MHRSELRRRVGRLTLFGVLLFTPKVHAESVAADSILTVTEARRDANRDFIPDLLGKRITVGGRANVYSGVIHTDRLVVFLEDDSSGIGIYNTEFGSSIAEGDSVIATGYVDQFEGLTRLSHVSYRTTIVHRPMATPPRVRISEVNNEQYESRLVSVEGEVTGKWDDVYGSYLTLREHRGDTDSLVTFLLFRHKPGLSFKGIEVGNRLQLTGVMIQFARGSTLNTGYELLPRYPEDLELLDLPTRSYLLILSISGGVLALSLIWIWMLRRQVARQTRKLRESEARFRSIFEGANDVMIVLGDDLVIEDANPAACHLYGTTREALLHRPFSELIGKEESPVPPNIHDARPFSEFETTLVRSETESVHLLAKMNVVDAGSERRVILVLRDITERKRAEQERESLIKELKTALEKVKTLGGLVPICSHCKKIRDDKGYWNQLEQYLVEHTDATLTHGICPDCANLYFPGLASKKS